MRKDAARIYLAAVDEADSPLLDDGSSKTTAKTIGWSKRLSHKLKVALKIALPHLTLLLFVMCYAKFGALVLQAIETSADQVTRQNKLDRISTLQTDIVDFLATTCSVQGSKWKSRLNDLFAALAQLHAPDVLPPYDPAHDRSDAVVQGRWDATDSLLYALSILVTAVALLIFSSTVAFFGYPNVTPVTAGGQIFSVLYGLLGIPLVVLTAVDVGRAICEGLTWLWYRFLLPCKRLCRSVSPWCRSKKRNLAACQRNDRTAGNGWSEDSSVTISERRGNLPLWTCLSLIVIANATGAIVYRSIANPVTEISEAFFICFQLLFNLCLTGLPFGSNGAMTICVCSFAICGLVLLSMCAHAAAVQLKTVFMQFHYFGRKIKWRKRPTATVDLLVGEQLTEIMQMIAAARLEIAASTPLFDPRSLQSGPRRNPQTLKTLARLALRRDTIAFMPELIAVLKFADDTDERETVL